MAKQFDKIEVAGRVTKRSLYYWILHRHYRIQLFLFLIIVVSLLFRVVPLEMQKRIVNQAVILKDYQLLFLYCGIYAAAVLLAGVTKYAINYLQVLIGQKILIEIRTELYRHILSLPLQFYRTMLPGTVVSAMTAELNAIGFFMGGALAIPLTSVLTYLTFLGFMVSVNPMLALLSSVFYPLELLVIPRLQRRYNRRNKERIQTIRQMSNVVNETVSGIQDVKSYGGTDFEVRRLHVYINKLYTSLKQLFLLKYAIKFTDNLFQSFGPMILFLVGGILIIRGQFTLGALVAFLSAYEKIYDPWREMLAFYQSYQDAQVRYRQIMTIFDKQPAGLLMAPGQGDMETTGSVEVEDVNYRLANNTQLLNGICLKIQPGEHIAVVGFSGSGKSTLALLLARLYDTTSGTIRLGGHDISLLSQNDICDTVTVISQKPVIFSGTILDNLLYGLDCCERTQPDQKELLQLLHDVGFEEDILWFGVNSIIPAEKVRKYKSKFLQMRKIIHMELGEQFSEVVEFYDVNKFLYYAPISENLIFGDSGDGSYTNENLIDNVHFLRLLDEMDLEKDLLNLGIVLMRITIEVLHSLEGPPGPDFFQATPMEVEEIEVYHDLGDQLELHTPQQKNEKQLLICLALRFIPAKHTIVALNPLLEKKIFLARHYFLNQIMGIDVHSCHAASQDFLSGANVPNINDQEQEEDFVAYCPIRYLCNHSLRNNILFGSPRKENKDIVKLQAIAWKTFRQYGLLEEIMFFGLDYDVGSQGSSLSGGQQQKLALARGLLKEPPVLILDEATSGLDNQSQARIQNLLTKKYRGKTTVVSIIHRLDLAQYYDRIVVLEGGLVVEEGDFAELMAMQGKFYTLIKGS